MRLTLARAGLTSPPGPLPCYLAGSSRILDKVSAVVRLERIRIEFDAEQDRLLMRILIDGSAEVKLWLTRRCVQRLWTALMKMAEIKPDIQRQANPEARNAILHFEHEKALREVKFARPGEDAPRFAAPRSQPLGPAPLLVTRIQARRLPDGRTQIGFLPNEGDGAHLTLSENLLHGVMRLVQQAVEKADWSLPLNLPAASFLTPADEGTARTLN